MKCNIKTLNYFKGVEANKKNFKMFNSTNDLKLKAKWGRSKGRRQIQEKKSMNLLWLKLNSFNLESTHNCFIFLPLKKYDRLRKQLQEIEPRTISQEPFAKEMVSSRRKRIVEGI